MSITKPQLSFEISYKDEHLIAVEVQATNGRFAGVTTLYFGEDGREFTEFAETLRGFPKEIAQVVVLDFGLPEQERDALLEQNSNMKIDTSYVKLTFLCIGRNAKTAVDIILEEYNWIEREEARGKVSFELLFDPASLDKFVQELFELGNNKKGKASLIGITGK